MVSNIDQQRQRVQEARRRLNEARKQAQERRQELQRQRESLPERTSQKALRQTYKGLQGRDQRRKIQGAERSIDAVKEQVKKYEREQLDPFEKQVKSAEGQIKEYDERQQAIKVARKMYAKKIPYRFTDGYVREYLKEMYQQGAMMDEQRAKMQEDINAGKISIPEFEKKYNISVKDLVNANIKPDLEAVKQMTTRLDRVDKVKVESIMMPSTSVTGEIQPVREANNTLDRWSQYLQSKRGESQTALLRGETGLDIGATQFLTGLGLSAVGGLQFGRDLITDPKQTFSDIKSGLKTAGNRFISGEGFPEVSQLLMEEPVFVSGYATGEFLQAKGLGYLGKKTGSLGNQLFTRLDPRYAKVQNVDDLKFIQFSGTTDDAKTIRFAGQLDDIGEELSQQARLVGQNVDAVSAQRNLFGFFDDSKVVRKPLPNEELLSQTTRNLLNKFDEGKLSASQIDNLNARIIKETGGKGLLERSFFADPRGRVRVSRLGVLDDGQKRASFLDVLSGDVTTKANKPQILFFEDVKIANLPTKIRNKLLRGIPLTADEQAQLRKLQLTPTGEFKPIGFLSREPEVTLAPSEIIVKEGTPAVTLINGKRVSVVRGGIGSSSDELSSLMTKRSVLGLNLDETKRLNQLMSQESGLSPYSPTPYLNPYSLGTSSLFIGAKDVSSSSPVQDTTSNIMISVPESSQPISPKSYNVLSISKSPQIKTPKSPSFEISSFKPPKETKSPLSPTPKSPRPKSPQPSSPYYPPKKPTPQKPIPKPPRSRMIRNLLKKVREEPEFFEVKGRRFGEDITLLKTRSKKKAQRGLKQFLSGSLGASGQILKSGKALRLEDLPLFQTKEFRKSKKEKDRIVQKSSFRLKKGDSQVREINFFKKTKPKKKKSKKNKFFDFL